MTSSATPAPSTRGEAGLDPLALASAFVLENGQTWGTVALDWQERDARAVLDTDATAPRRHYLLRGRGMSKTTDVAALVLALLVTTAPARSRSYIYAADGDQAALFTDAIAGFIARTTGLAGAVDIGARSVTVRGTGATLTVETSDGASAFGLRPWLVVVDELALWPTTANYRRLWSAIVSALPKVPDSRLVVITTAGSPTGLGAEVWAEAEQSSHWRAARTPGPSPWWSADDTEAVTGSLTAAEYRRLILCEWAEGEDALTTPDDIAAAIRSGSTSLPPRRGIEYVAALDIGTRRDLTALVVGHSERRETGRVVVIDRVLYWRPRDGHGGRVDLSEVEAATLALCREYRVARLRFDRMQAEQLSANLQRAGIRTEEYVFSSAGANRLARALASALRDRALELPDDDETRAEFLATRLVETGPSTVKLQNPPGQHDDIVAAVGMVAVDLAAKPETGRASISSATHARIPRRLPTDLGRRVSLPLPAQLRRAAQQGPRIPSGAIIMPGTANSPPN
ncbi:hypothetical protein C5B85_01895 [Pseudoclavibacter sp. AY1F1]|uniref:hypothetical protein n=1 Tax=Pseudoclavibacter sp. AY1F1 TaxID=2080583 RepID=UPI000CE91D77|nr:hypothetical protein [Pseudoclavibacter sp. AY1F1]PPF47052.1 hypothetical protein C5B85_01895 [Pseudoclavibacter sp. AY1F1]